MDYEYFLELGLEYRQFYWSFLLKFIIFFSYIIRSIPTAKWQIKKLLPNILKTRYYYCCIVISSNRQPNAPCRLWSEFVRPINGISPTFPVTVMDHAPPHRQARPCVISPSTKTVPRSRCRGRPFMEMHALYESDTATWHDCNYVH